MKVIICENYEEMSAKAADIFAAQLTLKPDSILGLATGSTPVGMYKNLIKMNEAGKIDFSAVKTFNLDEYYPIKRDNSQSYFTFMNENLFSHINIDMANTHVPNGETDDAEAECKEYEKKLAAAGGVDLQVLGIGQNGHIAFNEPDDALFSYTHVTDLTESTINANARFFDSADDVPTQAITMGMGAIMSAKKVILIANGKSKEEIVKKAFFGPITPKVPASILQLHPDVTVIYSKN